MGAAALAFVLAVTAAWWALALWPVPGEMPEWLARTRWVCFNAAPDGLPDATGWLVLIGQPLSMLLVLMVLFGERVRMDLRALGGCRVGRASLGLTAALLVLGLGAASWRVVSAADAPAFAREELPPDTYPRLDREAPALGLVSQSGQRIELAQLLGRPALVTFAFGHCATVCPLIVREVLEAQARTRRSQGDPVRVPRVVVVTLDPWRDTPSRLPFLAEHWKLGEDAFVLSGEADEVNALLDRWNVARERDPKTGEVVHPPLVYVLGADGRLAYAASGGSATLTALLERS